ncbi:MAG: 30S ribosomal protein S17 [Nitrospinae bacterium RIFCSPLOWO2_02_FULL_39_110]|nr:MAG: 30S ribosomal protein S17 [Nitrospinae bacterium RIFCSPHIGHO2_02_39_11]OGV99940.1 MAG: 30S ribosomal protein S17 [Nitrospinae bacterium RIFCSPHIGHO2_12_FULL_39_42]OGW02134.1 MAG: 30S ribosomal protein S17 [Nitrospinae bacterium RIFCSPHIGHO2_02_FULL_39_82]OGW02323.1 MAG: 30S ribosomal protein S17 [Nitrospinae bacterium RIFCSPLOWO2_02_39_17]OGW04681.1 MAG: 30S ribosomal protein S17 [Nitrospinae bacterium RIFCSPLOWO2_02_FULL_39_110]OGW09914.1 MAG: 30S ribosomal protein S17 [Nitrospinae ba
MDERLNRKIRTGTVISDKMDKTVVVKVERFVKHPVYKKIIRRSNKFKVHDEKNECSVGDKIKIIETRPLSKEKRWRLLEIVERANQ